VIRTGRWWLAVALAVMAAVAAAPRSSSAQNPEVDRWLDGSLPLSLGFDTTRFRVSTLGTRSVIGTEDPELGTAPYRLLDADLLGTAMSLGLKLRWPTTGASALGGLAPYLSFGPTVLLPGADASRSGPPGGRSEGSMALGLSWGAGLSWRFTRNAELFGGYRFLQFGRDSLSHGDRTTPSDTELTGHDVLYGISIRF
jgi:opacity protein-like surface antigen